MELWDVYDENRNKTGKVIERGKYKLEQGEYHIVVTGIIINSKNEILLSQRAPNKPLPLQWECNGGSILSGETSLGGIVRELKEELGLEFSKKEAIFLKTVKNKTHPNFKDLWVFRKDVDIKDIKFVDEEAIAAKWVSIDEFIQILNDYLVWYNEEKL